jgi:hypothetical protein
MQHPAALFVVVCLAGAALADQPMDFKITHKKGDTIEVKVEKDRVVFDIRSPFGIGKAGIERAKAEWPKAVVLRLHLKGLEHFDVTAGPTKLSAAAGVRNGRVEARVWKDGDENRPLDDKSPHWLKIAAGAGSFDIELPRALFDGNPPALAVSWIDFYRN